MRDYYLAIIHEERKGFIPLVLCAILRFLSWIYISIVAMIRFFYQQGFLRSYDLGRPVISVGNITWGGVGKTPLVEYLVRECLADGKKPVVLMRGYMSKSNGNHSDEAQLLRQAFNDKVPVIAQKDRVQAAFKVPSDYAHDLFILDDGFQHWRVKRDLNIVVIDSMNPFGNGAVIPRGSLREHFWALSQADIVVLTKCDFGEKNFQNINEKLKRYCPHAKVVKSIHQAKGFIDLKTGDYLELSSLAGQSALLVSGIGNPQGFDEIIKGLDIDVRDHLVYPDHHVYTKFDLEHIFYELKKNELAVLIVTSKDAVKFKLLMEYVSEKVMILVLNIEIVIQEGEQVLSNEILRLCHQ